VVAAVALAGVAQGKTYITAEDRKVASKADDTVAKYCASALKASVDREAGHADMVYKAGGRNVILEGMQKAKDETEIVPRIKEEVTTSFLLSKGSSLVMSACMLVLWFIASWTYCWCCRRLCQCSEKLRQTRTFMKAFGVVLLSLLVIGIFFGTLLAIWGYTSVKLGFDNMMCSAAKFGKMGLSGQESPQFAGLMPTLEVFSQVDDSLEDDTDFMHDTREILDSTGGISKAWAVANNTLLLFGAMMRENEQVIAKFLHKCEFCEGIGSLLPGTIESLDHSTGAALAQVRNEVELQLSAARRKALQKGFRNVTKPIIQAKDMMRDILFNVERKEFEDYVSIVSSVVLVLVLLIVAFAFLLMIPAGSTLYLFIQRERDGSIETAPAEGAEGKADPGATGREAAPPGMNPFNAKLMRCACYGWCWGFLYAASAFAVGGIVMAMSVPLANGCLILSDIDGTMIRSIAPALQLDLEGHEGDQVVSIVDRCINPKNFASNENLMDLLMVEDKGQRLSFREQLLRDFEERLYFKLDRLRPDHPSLGNEKVKSLLKTLRGNPIEALIVADEAKMKASDEIDLNNLTMDTRAKGLQIGFQTSASCADHHVGAGFGELSGKTVPGIDTFVARLAELGSKDSSASCAKSVTCKPDLENNTAQVCKAGNAYIAQKKQLLSAHTFRCDLFRVNNGFCDPLHMKKSAGAYTKDCLQADGTMTVGQRSCTFPQFVQYVKDFDERIVATLQRLDAVGEGATERLNTDLRYLLEEHLIEPLEIVSDGINCGVIATIYREMIDSFCYQGVSGFGTIANSYNFCGGVTIVLIAMMYAVWRRVTDNWYSFGKAEDYEKLESLTKDQEEAGATILRGSPVVAPTSAGPPSD